MSRPTLFSNYGQAVESNHNLAAEQTSVAIPMTQSGIRRQVRKIPHNLPGMINGRIKVFRSSQAGVLTLRHLVLAYAIMFLIVKAFQFGKEVKCTVDMLIIYSKSPALMAAILHDQTSKIFWKGASQIGASHQQEVNHFQAEVRSIISSSPSPAVGLVFDEMQMKTDIHVWNSFLFLQGLEYLFAWLLVFAIKGEVFLGVIAWLSFAIPVFFLYVVQILTNVLTADLLQTNPTVPTNFFIELLLQSATILMSMVYVKYYAQPHILPVAGSARTNNNDILQIAIHNPPRNPVLVL